LEFGYYLVIDYWLLIIIWLLALGYSNFIIGNFNNRRCKMEITGGELIRAFALLAAGICMGLGAIGPGIGEGFAAGKACEGVSREPNNAALITRTMLIGQAVSESTGIYSLIIALLLMFVI
jgi:F-type H+-transporting ATPase subunit c